MKGTTRDDVLRSLDIDPGAFVVEVGGGHQPFERSNLILDKYPFDNLHRVQDLAHRAPVLIADAVRLPIPAKGCDVLFSSHVIEHLPEPDRFLSEIRRCSRRVYLEFPGARRELMFAWSFHEWLVVAEGTHLTFYRNDIPQLFGDFFHANYDFLFDAWASRRHLELNAHVWCESDLLTWSFAEVGAMEHLTARSARGAERVTEAPIEPVRYSYRQLLILGLQRALPDSLFSRLVHSHRERRTGAPIGVSADLAARLMCLECSRTGLVVRGDELACEHCGYTYRRRSGLLDFDVGGGTRP